MSTRKVVVKQSDIHGHGAFAGRHFAPEDLVIEYLGEIIDLEQAQERYQTSDAEAGHTYYFAIDDVQVIDGGAGGNAARFINHGCDPNVEAVVDGERIFIHARRPITLGEELLLDYQLDLDVPADDEVRLDYACACSARDCRGTMLAS